jgi:CBS domain containing-hemolysin-like protein
VSGDTVAGLLLIVLALALLVVATAAETGVVFVSRARVRSLVAKGLPRAELLNRYVEERHALLGAVAVARNIAVVLGIATGTFLVVREITTWFALSLTMLASLIALALLEIVPRLIVARSPERWSLLLSPAITVFRVLFGIPARLLDLLAGALVPARSPAEQPFEATDDEEELLRLVELHEGNGAPQNGEMEMIKRIAYMVDTSVREIMVPRIDMAAVDAEAAVEDVIEVIVGRGYSRIPIFKETIDNIVGVLYAKDILRYLAEGKTPPSLTRIARPPYFIPEGKHIDELLSELRENKVHIAIVVDEYGGTAGLVTIEDVLEEIVGEIQDEYDREEAEVQRISDSEAILDARASIDEINEMFDLELSGDEYDSVGGFVYHELGRIPTPGDEVHTDGLKLKVLSVAGHRIKKVRVTRAVQPADDATSQTASQA